MLTEFYQAARDVYHALVGVTGATSSIGRAITVAFAAEGAHFVVSGRNEERGDRVADGYSRNRL